MRSARELHEGLLADEARVRLQTLVAVGAQSDAALTFGLHDGRDVVDVLVDRATSAPYHSERLMCLRTLLEFADGRVEVLCVRLLQESDVPEVLFTASEYLARQPLGSLREVLGPLLLKNDSVARARVVASLLVQATDLGVAERLRLSLAAMNGPEPPPLDTATARLWLEELRGPFRCEARTLIEAQGRPAFLLMSDAWDQLSDEDREWLALWGLSEFPDVVASW